MIHEVRPKLREGAIGFWLTLPSTVSAEKVAQLGYDFVGIDLQHGQGEYRDALAINPGYPEAHFYLAVTLEKLGRSSEARPHWKEYRALAPDGEFVELATEFSD